MPKSKMAGAAAATENVPDLSGNSNPVQIATYIADVSLEMRNLARKANLSFLAYLLEMTFQEAFDISQNQGRSKNGG